MESERIVKRIAEFIGVKFTELDAGAGIPKWYAAPTVKIVDDGTGCCHVMMCYLRLWWRHSVEWSKVAHRVFFDVNFFVSNLSVLFGGQYMYSRSYMWWILTVTKSTMIPITTLTLYWPAQKYDIFHCYVQGMQAINRGDEESWDNEPRLKARPCRPVYSVVLLSLILLLSLSLLKSQLGQYDVVKVYKPSASACLFAAAASRSARILLSRARSALARSVLPCSCNWQ